MTLNLNLAEMDDNEPITHSPQQLKEAADRAGCLMLIASLLMMGHHISGRAPASFTANQAVDEADQIYGRVAQITGVQPGKAF